MSGSPDERIAALERRLDLLQRHHEWSYKAASAVVGISGAVVLAFFGITISQLPGAALTAIKKTAEFHDLETLKTLSEEHQRQIDWQLRQAKTDAAAIQALLAQFQGKAQEGSGVLYFGDKQICWGTTDRKDELMSHNKNVFDDNVASQYTFKFPAPFAEPPVVVPSVEPDADTAEGFVINWSEASPTTYTVKWMLSNYEALKTDKRNSIVKRVSYIAIGRRMPPEIKSTKS